MSACGDAYWMGLWLNADTIGVDMDSLQTVYLTIPF